MQHAEAAAAKLEEQPGLSVGLSLIQGPPRGSAQLCATMRNASSCLTARGQLLLSRCRSEVYTVLLDGSMQAMSSRAPCAAVLLQIFLSFLPKSDASRAAVQPETPRAIAPYRGFERAFRKDN